jgi:hypothetical protein
MATGYEKYLTRVGHSETNSKMSKRLPKPNVCRIEVLDGAARRSYMGGFQKSIDTFRTEMLEAIANKSNYDLYEPFYGILKTDTGNGPSFKVSATWKDNDSNKSGFARMNTILTGGGGNSGLLGVIPFAGNYLSTNVNKLANTAESFAQMGMELSGVSNQFTGSMTIKKFGGAKIEADLPLKFQWYLPEQEDMCRQSIRRLIMMTYVRPMDMEGYDIVNKMISGLMSAGETMWEGAKEMIQKPAAGVSRVMNNLDGSGQRAMDYVVTGNINSADQYKDSTPAAQTTESTSDNPSSSGIGAGKAIKETLAEVAGIGVDTYNSINTFFGGEITANPLPVRVSIGHYMDLEPMVINGVKFNASTEQFVSADGTHLPVFIDAEVSVSYWMQPGPTKDFLSILGTEVFEPFIDRANLPSSKNQADGKISRNNNPSTNKKRK